MATLRPERRILRQSRRNWSRVFSGILQICRQGLCGAATGGLLLAALGPWSLAIAEEAAPPPPAPPLRKPFATPLPWILSSGETEAGAAFGLAADDPGPFPDPDGTERDRLTLGIGAAYGLGGRSEISARFGAVDTSEEGGTSGFVADDLRIAFTISIGGAPPGGPAIAAVFAAKVPTAPDGPGTDESDLGAFFVAGIRRARWGAFAGAGLSLLGNPGTNGSQDDVATFGAGSWWEPGPRLRWTAEIEGSAFSRFDNEGARLRAGLQGPAPAAGRTTAAAHLALFRGISGEAARWGIEAGITFRPRRDSRVRGG